MEFRDNQRIEATFCFVDITGFTALTETRGEEAAADLVSLFVTLVRNALAHHEGALLEVIGDAALFCCPGPGEAVGAVADLYQTAQQVPHFPALRAGLHNGHVLRRDGRFYGTTINLAARVAGQAAPGQVLATAPVAQTAAQRGIGTRSLGTYALKNLTAPVELFALDVSGHLQESRTDPVCRATVRRADAACILETGGQTFWFCSQACADRFAADATLFLPTGTSHEG